MRKRRRAAPVRAERDFVAFAQAVLLSNRVRGTKAEGIIQRENEHLATLLGVPQLHSFQEPWRGFEVDRRRLWTTNAHCTGSEWLALMQLRDLEREITQARLDLLEVNSDARRRANAVALARRLVPEKDRRLMVLAGIHWIATNPRDYLKTASVPESWDMAYAAVSWLAEYLGRIDRQNEGEALKEAALEHADVVANAVRMWTRRRGGRSNGGSKWRAAYEALRVLGLVAQPVNASRADAIRKLWEGSQPERSNGK